MSSTRIDLHWKQKHKTNYKKAQFSSLCFGHLHFSRRQNFFLLGERRRPSATSRRSGSLPAVPSATPSTSVGAHGDAAEWPFLRLRMYRNGGKFSLQGNAPTAEHGRIKVVVLRPLTLLLLYRWTLLKPPRLLLLRLGVVHRSDRHRTG